MSWEDPIDKYFREVPQDWANHVIYGGMIGSVLMAFGMSAKNATLLVLLVGAVKKTADFILEGEPLWMCIGKTLAGAIWPLTIWLLPRDKA